MNSSSENIEKETQIEIRNKLLKEDFKQAEDLLQKMVGSFCNIPHAMKNILFLGSLLLASGIPGKNISSLLSQSSKMLFKLWAADDIFNYLIEFQKQDPELYRYIIQFDEKALFKSKECVSIDTQINFDKNITWLKIYNRKFLKDIFSDLEYKRDKAMGSFIESAYSTSGYIYYCINEIWHSLTLPKQETQIDTDNSIITLLYQFNDLNNLAAFIHQHKPVVLINDILKFDRYVIIDRPSALTALQILALFDLEGGNYRVHFMAESCWKKRLTGYVINGYFMPQKIIAVQYHFEILKQYTTLLSSYYENTLPKARAEKLKHIYPNHYLANLKKDFKKDISKLRIMILTSRHSTYIQYASEELKKGFKALGCACVLLRERPYQGRGYTVEFVFKIIENFKPNLILAINNFRAPFLSAFLPNIPFVTWVHDYPENLPGSCEKIFDNDFVFAATRADLEKRLSETFPALKTKTIHLLPFIRNKNNDVVPVSKPKKQYDVGYISNVRILPEAISYYDPEKKTGTNEERVIHDFIRQMERLQPHELAAILVSKEKCFNLVQQTLERLNLEMTPPLHINHPLVIKTLRFHVGHFLQKILPVKFLIESGMEKLFLGGQGWEQIPMFKPFSKGLIPHKDLSRVMDDIAINLNLSAVITFHPKVGEALDANSFFISSWKGEADDLSITEFFVEDEEVVLFKTYDELLEKIKYYLQQPEKREIITQKARKKFFNLFSAEKGSEQILNTVLGNI